MASFQYFSYDGTATVAEQAVSANVKSILLIVNDSAVESLQVSLGDNTNYITLKAGEKITGLTEVKATLIYFKAVANTCAFRVLGLTGKQASE